MATKTKKPAKMGRPKAVIDMRQLEVLCTIQCTKEEIAACLNISLATLKNRMKDDAEFLAVYIKGQEQGKMSLRRKQYEVAKSGNTTMLIWLGKQYLDQKDQSRQQLEHSGTVKSVVEKYSDEELKKRVDKLAKAAGIEETQSPQTA